MRLIKESDIEALVELARCMHAESPVYRIYEFSEDAMRGWFYAAIEAPHDFFCAVAELNGEAIGLMLACAVPIFFSTQRMTTDLGLYVAGYYRGSRAACCMVRLYEGWAKAQGCVRVVAGVTAGINVDAAIKFYKRLGFKDQGTVLVKEIM